MSLADLASAIRRGIGHDERPVVVYSAYWVLARAYRLTEPGDAAAVVRCLVDAIGPHRTLLMPTFTDGYIGGLCDLDARPGQTGVLPEHLRRLPGARRTASAFFSFAAAGPAAAEVAALRASNAHGDGSVFEWLEQRDAHIVMLGTRLHHDCANLHRMEWLLRDRIVYRYMKRFSGALRETGCEFEMEEELFVRCMHPEAVNDWSAFRTSLEAASSVFDANGIPVRTIGAQALRACVLAILDVDPLAAISNRSDFETASAERE